MQLRHPGAPRIREVGKYRERPDEIEMPVWHLKRRPFVRQQHVERWRQICAEPLHAREVNVAAPELALRVLDNGVAQDPSGTAAEIEGAPAVEAPVWWQERLDQLP